MITGMTAASVLGVFIIPVLFVVVERVAMKKKRDTVELLRPAEAEGGHD